MDAPVPERPRLGRLSPLAASTALIVVSAAVSCGNSELPAKADGGSRQDSGGSGARPPLALPPIVCEPDLESIKTNLFAVTCDFDTCHGGSGAAWNLYLARDETEEDLLTRKAGSCPPWDFVVPGNPEQSFLWNKVFEEEPACGLRMPWGYERLPDPVLACIREWIEGLAATPTP